MASIYKLQRHCNGAKPNLQIIQVIAELSVVSDGAIQKGEESLHVGAAGVTELIFQCFQLLKLKATVGTRDVQISIYE